MAQPDINITPDPVQPPTAAPGAAETPCPSPASKVANAPKYFGEALDDAELLLKYSAELGIAVDEDIRDHILQARAASSTGWDEPTAANLLTALAQLAARLKPVTAESLKACRGETRSTVRQYWLVAICLAVVIVPFSLASFVASAISGAVRVDIATANDLTVKLRTQLGPPPGPNQAAPPRAGSADADSAIIAELQQFATTVRAIDARARQLNVLVVHSERDPFAPIRNDPGKIHETFQLPKGLPNFDVAAENLTTVYQDVRYFAQSLLDDVSFFYGAITSCLLPVLYALLGTCAYLLRTFEQQMANQTFVPSTANSARFLIAGISGAVVGLFNNFTIGQGASIPPLAIAFLAGYAVDVFFAFLEGMLQSFTRNNTGTPSKAPSSS
jgi:hypothetical protein